MIPPTSQTFLGGLFRVLPGGALRDASTRWARQSKLPACAVIVLSPIAAFFALRLPPISQNNFTDAMFYLGYANNFTDLIDRDGFLYYAVRFGPIFTDMAFAGLFGAMAGFSVMRYLLCVIVGFLLHAVLAERFGRGAALLGVIAWTFNPITARILLSTYVDSTIVPYGFIGILLLLRHGSWLPRTAGAGALMCASLSGNIFVGPMLALGMASYFLLNRDRPYPELARDLLTALIGAGLTLWAFTLLYDWLFGVTSLLQPVIDQTLRLAGGETKLWTRPAKDWLLDSPHIYAPFFVTVAGFALWRWTGDRMALAAVVYLTLFTAFYWINDLAFDGYSLSFYPYFSYWQPPMMLGVGATACLTLRLAPINRRGATFAALLAALAGPAFLCGQTGMHAPPFPWMLAAMLAAGLLFALSVPKPALRPFGLIGLLAVSSLLQSWSPEYNSLLGKERSNDRDLARSALQLIELLPRIADDGKSLAFWYSPASSPRLTMLQSAYLPYSRLRRPDKSYVEIGRLLPQDAELLRNPQLGHLVIMDLPGGRVDASLAELERVGVPYEVVQRRTLGSPETAFDVAQVLLRHDPGPVVARFDASAIRQGTGARIRYDYGGSTLTTGRITWNWDGVLDLTGLAQPGKPATVCVTLEVLRGRMGIALISTGPPDRVLQENLAARTREPVTVSVRASDGALLGRLMFRNWMMDGTRSVARIRSITLHQ